MKTIQHKFVELIPDTLEEGVLYITPEYATASHKCACGCGLEVVTPLSPKDWKLTFDGKTVSLYPSIGNWCFPCRSHYWIENGRIVNASRWPSNPVPEKIEGYKKPTDKNRNHKRKRKKKKWFFFWGSR